MKFYTVLYYLIVGALCVLPWAAMQTARVCTAEDWVVLFMWYVVMLGLVSVPIHLARSK